jgi:response regulator RpfG family c-di-GMP phosphodiesterase
MEEEQLTLLLVDNDIDSRMRLRHAVSTVQAFGEAVQVNNLEDARLRLDCAATKFDVVFLSYEFPREQLSKLISDGKSLKCGRDAAYVMLFAGNEDRNKSIAEGLLAGTDGFLFEPFSIDQLVDVTKLAAKIKLQRAAARQMLSLDFIVKDFVRLIDVYSRLTMMGCDASKARARVERMSNTVKSFEPEAQEAFLQALVEMFMLQPTPDPIFQRFKKEGIRSMRLRMRLAENLTEKKEMHRQHQEAIQRRLPPRRHSFS